MVPNARSRRCCRRPDRAGPYAHRRPGRVCPTRWSTPTRTTSARASASPGGSTRATRRCCAAGSGSSIRPSRSRASATCSRPTSSAIVNTRRGGRLSNGFSGGTPSTDLADFGNQGIDPNLQSPDIYQYNLTLERELPGNIGLRVSYIGSTMRKLLVDRGLQHAAGEHDAVRSGRSRRTTRGCRSRSTATTWTSSTNRGSGQFHALQLEAARAAGGAAWRSTRPTRCRTRTATRPIPATARSVRCSSIRTTSRRTAVPIRTSSKHRLVANATWDVPVGRGRKHGANMAAWADALFGGWTVSTLFQARSGQNLTPFFSGFYTTSPWNTGKPLDGLGTAFCCAWRPDQIRRSEQPAGRATRSSTRPRTRSRRPASSATPRRAACRDRAPGSSTSRSTRTSCTHQGFRLQFSALLDNAFNHPQFFPAYGSGFVDLTSYLIDGDPNNGTTGVLGADSIGNTEGFSPGRVIRLGITSEILALALAARGRRLGGAGVTSPAPTRPSSSLTNAASA